MKKYFWTFLKTVCLEPVRFFAKLLIRGQRLKYGEIIPLFVDFNEEEDFAKAKDSSQKT